MSDEERQPDELSFEDAMESLESIVSSLEGERLPLEEMLQSYERGVKLLRVCRSRIETARQRVEIITADLEGRGKATLSDFSALEVPEAASPAEESSAKRSVRKKPAAPEPPAGNGSPDEDIRLF
ncbi:exodeoxyribonuclease VII small subunit [Roseimicrobium gellanilyticum]|uniref:Exodeoxyribonuclease 7 small subunit n=1 Tax=Roseimicrobium gellanilyticum TaxID=748857 RepID=A0A366HMT4_9BACT|nr:exodeoxyribonuclease VII small subunit [Roseimicrobium gellanilyticum]RBP43887.1 exodeoxyribonuclease VII small subunit [Roseimicrobium gellanilyticum]